MQCVTNFTFRCLQALAFGVGAFFPQTPVGLLHVAVTHCSSSDHLILTYSDTVYHVSYGLQGTNYCICTVLFCSNRLNRHATQICVQYEYHRVVPLLNSLHCLLQDFELRLATSGTKRSSFWKASNADCQQFHVSSPILPTAKTFYGLGA